MSLTNFHSHNSINRSSSNFSARRAVYNRPVVTAFLKARDSRKWSKGTLENGKRTQKMFPCPLAIFQCPVAPFSAVSCNQEGCKKWAFTIYENFIYL